MSISTLLNAPHLVYQTCDEDMCIPEPAIAVCHDDAPIIVVSQEGREVLVNLETVNDLCRALKQVKRQAEEARLRAGKEGEPS